MSGSRLLMVNGFVCALVCLAGGLAAGWFTQRVPDSARGITDGPSAT